MSVAGKKKDQCCGCAVCQAVCPTQCISIKADSKGFAYARVDTGKCIECGRCERACPFPADTASLTPPVEALAAWALDTHIHSTSSSGGIAAILADHIIRSGGVVYGCVTEGIRTIHRRIDSADLLPALRGSKYVQSDLTHIFAPLADDLRHDRHILFIGTPCQAAAISRFTPRTKRHLITIVDLICHGVPSQKMISDHLRHLNPGHRPLTNLSFRQGLDYCISADTADTPLIRSPFDWKDKRDTYLRSFLACSTLRPSCYACGYASPDRASDITIGDFWGIRDTGLLPPDHRLGISLILPTTAAGADIIRAISPRLFTTPRPIDEAIGGNARLRHHSTKTIASRTFSRLYPILPFHTAVAASRLISKIKRRLLTFIYWKSSPK